MQTPESRPVDLTIHREKGQLHIRWADDHQSTYELAWLRANCPCATCREERRERAESGGLIMASGPQPSAEVVGAELVGHYALRFDWADGHSSGIFPFSALRFACPCPECNDGDLPQLLAD
jgi:DUF971 family protein